MALEWSNLWRIFKTNRVTHTLFRGEFSVPCYEIRQTMKLCRFNRIYKIRQVE
jgi:hypothetical protein